MSRSSYTVAGERVASLKAARAALAASYGLPETDPRIGQAALVKLNQENWERDVLMGRSVPNFELQAYANIISQLLGPPAVPLTVRFVDGFICPRCQADTGAEAAIAKAAAAEAAPPAPETPAAPPFDDKVVPLKPPPITPSPPPPAAAAGAPTNFFAALSFVNDRSGSGNPATDTSHWGRKDR